MNFDNVVPKDNSNISEYAYGDKVEVKCAPRYELVEVNTTSIVLTCLSTRNWNFKPSCSSKYYNYLKHSVKITPNHTFIFNGYPSNGKYPADTRRENNVDSTLLQRHDVESTLNRRFFNVVCQLGRVSWRTTHLNT